MALIGCKTSSKYKQCFMKLSKVLGRNYSREDLFRGKLFWGGTIPVRNYSGEELFWGETIPWRNYSGRSNLGMNFSERNDPGWNYSGLNCSDRNSRVTSLSYTTVNIYNYKCMKPTSYILLPSSYTKCLKPSRYMKV